MNPRSLVDLARLRVLWAGGPTTRRRRVVAVHHCWVCHAEVTQPYWLGPDGTAGYAVWWACCETRWFEPPEHVRP